mgnify:CR=1 FL=1
MASNWPILSLLIWLPIFGGLAILAAGEQRAGLARLLALVVTVVTFALSVVLYAGFDTSTAAMQFTELEPWIETFSIQYHLGVDGFSVPLILLTAFFGPLVVIAGWEIIQTKVHQYMALFLIMEGLMVGVFCALDALLFYVFFEAMLIPMFLVIGMWGGPRRVYATIKFFLYTFLGSVFMLIGLIYLFIQSGSWSILEWHQYPLGLTVQKWLFLGFLAAFSWAVVQTMDSLVPTLVLLGHSRAAGVWMLGAALGLAGLLHLTAILITGHREDGYGTHIGIAACASAILPGWGQVLNGQRVKAALFVAGLWGCGLAWVLISPPVQEFLVRFDLIDDSGDVDLGHQLRQVERLHDQSRNGVGQFAESALRPVQKAIQEIAGEEQLNAVFDRNDGALMFVDNSLDLTDRVIQRLRPASR